MKKEKSSLTKKDLNYLGFINSNDIDILLSPEQNLSNIISANVYFDNLKHIAYPELIYDFLMKIQNFHEFILLNDIDRATTLNMLKTGILTLYRKGEVINKKDKQPKEFFLLLVGTVSYLNDSTSISKFRFCPNMIRLTQLPEVDDSPENKLSPLTLFLVDMKQVDDSDKINPV